MISVVPVVAVCAVIYGRYLQQLQKQFQDELANATTIAEEGTQRSRGKTRTKGVPQPQPPQGADTCDFGHATLVPWPDAASLAPAAVISNIRTMRAFSKEQRTSEQYSGAVQKRCVRGRPGVETARSETAGAHSCLVGAGRGPGAVGWACCSYLIGRTIALMYGLFNAVLGFVPQAAIAMVLWYGGKLTIEGRLTTGDLTAFLLYTLSVAMVSRVRVLGPPSFARALRSHVVWCRFCDTAAGSLRAVCVCVGGGHAHWAGICVHRRPLWRLHGGRGRVRAHL